MSKYRWGVGKKRARVQHAWIIDGEGMPLAALCGKPTRRLWDEIDFDTSAARCEKCVKLFEKEGNA